MKLLFTILLLVALVPVVSAQQNYQGVVHLKNGSIIHGKITWPNPDSSLKIETTDGNIFIYNPVEIEKITREEIKASKRTTGQNQDKLKGYAGMAQAGYSIKTGDYGMDLLRLDIIHGFRINPHFSIGLGTGLRYYFDVDAAVIPIFADFRANLLNKNVTPYWALGLGYSFNAFDNFVREGILLSPSAGVCFKVPGKTVINVGVGYELQELKILDYNYFYRPYYSTRDVGSISFHIGTTF
jgi:hypothetical protein